MSIQELARRFKGFVTREDVLLSGLVIIVALVSYTIGRSHGGTFDFQIQENEVEGKAEVIGAASSLGTSTTSKTENSNTINNAEGYVASKNGTKYHLPWCPGAKQIREDNKIFFATKEAAESAGYSPASNCKGI